jgi:hypothetical protein
MAERAAFTVALSQAAKSSFPIINRKGGLCGTSVPAFYTFSTPVDSAVDKTSFIPANVRSYDDETILRFSSCKRKTMDFPGFSAGVPCGKWPIAWIEWLHRSGTRHPHRSERSKLAERRTYAALRPASGSPRGSGEDRACPEVLSQIRTQVRTQVRVQTQARPGVRPRSHGREGASKGHADSRRGARAGSAILSLTRLSRDDWLNGHR